MKKVLFVALLSTAAMVHAAEFSLRIDNLENGHFSPAQLLSESYGFGCTGRNLSPALSWKNPPQGTKSYVLTMYDKDAPTGLGWMHWVVVNIPAHINKLPAGIMSDNQHLPPDTLQTRTDFGVPGFGGACPPKGQKHRYEFTLTALKVEKLDAVTADSTPALVGFFTKLNALGEAKFTVEAQR